MNKKAALVFGFLLSSLSLFSQQSPVHFGNGLFNLVGQDSTWTMKVAMRAQTLAISEWENHDGGLANLESNFL
ncbi:MAG: porin, partial [Flavobacteriaceae bacterium]